MNYIQLDYWDLALGALLLLGVAALSLLLQLRIEKKLLFAALRCALQLALVGLVLTKLFELVSPWWTGLAALAMVLFAGRDTMARKERGFQPLWAYSSEDGRVGQSVLRRVCLCGGQNKKQKTTTARDKER